MREGQPLPDARVGEEVEPVRGATASGNPVDATGSSELKT